MTHAGFIRWSGLALLLYAIHLLVRDFTFAWTHGSTEADMSLTLLGLTARQYSFVWTAFGLMGIFGFAGVYVRVSGRLSKLGQAGFVVAVVGLVLWFTSAVMLNWIVDPDADFYSPLVLGGWLLSLIAFLVLAVGLVLAGIDIQRTNALPRGRSVVLIMGFLLIPTVLLVGSIVGRSDDSLPWKVLYGAVSVPYDLCWLWLAVLQLTSRATPVQDVPGPVGPSGPEDA